MDNSNYKYNRNRSLDLFDKVSFIDAFYSFMNSSVFFNHINFSESASEADFRALKGDWDSVGVDFSEAMKKFDEVYCR